MNEKEMLHNLLDDLATSYRVVANDKDKIKLSKYHQALNDFLVEYEILQFKIDKINQYLEEYFIFDDKNGEYYQTHTFDKDNAKELHDILKEDK